MDEQPGFQLIGDHRDIPLILGLVVIGWNSCEEGLRHLIRAVATRGCIENWPLIEVLSSEMGTLGLTQAIRCYADEFPARDQDLAEAFKHVAALTERLKAYRNYYVHGITSVGMYGFDLSDEMFERDPPVTEAMIVGPFANIYEKSAKGRSKFVMDHIRAEQLAWLSHQLVATKNYVWDVHMSLCHFLKRSKSWRKSAPLPAPPPLPDVLVKRDLHPRLRSQSPALTSLAEQHRLHRERSSE